MKKSPNDLKQYHPFTLNNGLRVLLVQNTETQKAATALAVNIGHFHDPVDRQGLAHFLEHMLFLGTKKYPDGSDYQKFISQYGGSNNAWTATEHTCFFFDIHYQYLESALDRFSQFFIAPLLSEEFVNKERKNIDSEFKLKLKDDIRRLYDVHKETINPEHPFSKFSVGNTETLADRPGHNLRNEVAEFFKQNYVAKAMTLVVEGPQEIAQLKTLVEDKFSAISDKKPQQSMPNIPLYLPEQQKVSLHVKPVKNDRQLIISFALPSIDKYYQDKPEAILAYLLGHEGPNSILSVIKKKYWALGLTAGSGVNGYNFKDFNISIRLTEKGEQHTEEIISLVFAYLALLKAAPLPEHYFYEKKSIAGLSFHYHEKMKPLDSVSQLVINMHHYPAENYIFGDYIMEKPNQEKINELLKYFTPLNMRYVFISQSVNTNKMSRWYQVPYQVNHITPELLNKWSTEQQSSSLKLPPKNEFIVANPKVHACAEHEKQLTPEIIAQEKGLTFWYKQDHTFNVPKGYIYIGLDSPVTLESTKNIAMTRLFVDLYTESVIEQYYDAELAGIHYHLYSHQGGLTLQLSGISEKQPLLLSQLLHNLQNFSCTKETFSLMKQQLINHWKNTDCSKSISQLFSALSSTMQPKNPSSHELEMSLQDINFDEFELYCSQIFMAVNIDVLVHGNWRKEDALAINLVIKKAFTGQYHDKNQINIPLLDIKGLGNIEYPLYLPDHDYASVIYYPMQDRSLSTVAKTMITSQILSPQFFQQMRTEKQYGYLVGVGFVPINRYPGIAFYIQSPNVNSTDLAQAMDQFIIDCQKIIIDMDEDDWQHSQHGLASQLQEKDTSLRIKSQRFWNAICTKETDFKQKQRLIDSLLALTKNDVIDYLSLKISHSKNINDRFCLLSMKELEYTEESIHEITIRKASIKY